jgi:hypothetical protein
MLTVPQATSQARRHVDKIMPGVMATVESKLGHDLATDTPTVITTVTFPANNPNGVALMDRLDVNLNPIKIDAGPARITITRAR